MRISPFAVCVVFALPEEARPFVKRSSWRSKVLTAVSGQGAAKAARTTRALLRPETKLLIVCGFGGGLVPELVPGDLVLADRVINFNTSSPTNFNYLPDSVLLAAAESVPVSGVTMLTATLVTDTHVLADSAEKRSVGARSGAAVVDMETAMAVAVAVECGVPWLAVRAITDGVDDNMPFDFAALSDAEGNVSHGKVVFAALTHPWKIPALIRLGARSSLAAKNLASYLDALLEKLEKMDSLSE